MRFHVYFIIGHFIAPCSEMYGSERCTICPRGHAQPDFISSLDNERDCFLKKGECTAYGKKLYYIYINFILTKSQMQFRVEYSINSTLVKLREMWRIFSPRQHSQGDRILYISLNQRALFTILYRK